MIIKDEELKEINGGESGITSTFLSHLGTFLKTVYGIGQDLGGALRRISTGNVCRF